MAFTTTVDFHCPCCNQTAKIEIEFENIPGGLDDDESTLKITRAWNTTREPKRLLSEFAHRFLEEDDDVREACAEEILAQKGADP